jgi:CRISPR-associated exonuclease Cas4
MFCEDELLPISALQHLAFCERQWALIHLEQNWLENRLTAEGRILHERVHETASESRPGVRSVRGLSLRSLRVGLTGQADLIEFRGKAKSPVIIEYKRGRPKRDARDKVQVCAQALCLEEMLRIKVESAELYYGQERHRTHVVLDTSLRGETERLAARLHKLNRAAKTPDAIYERKCRNCSLIEICMPKATDGKRSALQYLRRNVGILLAEEV